MKIAIFSDIHDALPLLKTALAQIRETDALICCGDLCSPFVIKTLGESYSQPIYCVLGNNDGDPYLISERAKAFAQIQLTPFLPIFRSRKRIRRDSLRFDRPALIASAGMTWFALAITIPMRQAGRERPSISTLASSAGS
jgi:hypothetical protein